MKKKILFIINPIAGIKNKDLVCREIESTLNKSQFDFEIQFTSHSMHATELTRDAVKKNLDLIVAVGGDGTVNEIASELVGKKTALGIIPFGSGNALARHLGIPLKERKAVQTINSGKIISMDACLANEKYFFSTSGVGFDAHIAEHYSNTKKRGFWTYFKVIMQEFLFYKTQNYFMTIDGKQFEINAFLIAFANSCQYGYDFFIAPQADIQDGFIDVCIIKKFPKLLLPFIVLLILFKKHHWSKYISIIKAKNILVQGNGLKPINIDGESVPMENNMKITVSPSSLNVLIPNS